MVHNYTWQVIDCQNVKQILGEITWQRAASSVFHIPTARIQVPTPVFTTYREERKTVPLEKAL